MSNRLEQFIKDNREQFDEEMPSPKVWDHIQEKVLPEKKTGGVVVKINWMKWSAAAALVLIVMGIWALLRTNPPQNLQPGELAGSSVQPSKQIKNDTSLLKEQNPIPENNTPQTASASVPDHKNPVQDETQNDQQNNASEELYHFAKLVEIKHRELKSMTKDEPLLYKQFSDDVNKLDSVYHSLETQLSKKQNSEELLEAMIQNLQLQMQLLNRQLGIIKQLNHSKKTAYEKAYKSA